MTASKLMSQIMMSIVRCNQLEYAMSAYSLKVFQKVELVDQQPSLMGELSIVEDLNRIEQIQPIVSRSMSMMINGKK